MSNDQVRFCAQLTSINIADIVEEDLFLKVEARTSLPRLVANRVPDDG
jgi:hypothetical protein